MPRRHIYVNGEYANGALNPTRASCDYADMERRRIFVREWRKHRGLTQAQLAERIGIDQGQLSKIENRKRQYDEEFLALAADALRCEPVDLLIRDPTDPDGIWSVWDALAPTQRRQVVEMAKVLKRTGTDD